MNPTGATRVMSSKVPSVETLSHRISCLTADIQSHLDASSPSVQTTREYESLRASLNDAALDLLDLVNGPRNTLQALLFSHYDMAALQAALDLGFFHHVPLKDATQPGAEVEAPTATVTEIAQRAGVDADRTGRIMKLLVSRRIFEEVPGTETLSFKHNANSALVAREPQFHALADWQMDDMLKATSEISNLIRISPHQSDTIQSAFAKRFGVSLYQFLEDDPSKATRFAQAMSSWSQMDRQITELFESFPWESLGKGTIIDVGGGIGHISVALGKRFPNLNFIVQDTPRMISQAKENLSGRVSFQHHDFFTPQPDQGASAYLIRQCLHNHPDEDCVKILKGFVPALDASGGATPLLINEVVLPDADTVTKYEDHRMRQVDICMMVALGSKQRTKQDWLGLLRAADERFTIRNVRHNPLGTSLLEVYLQDMSSG